jgi:deoxyinosine 3'endonuclease (endonuclease V)
MRVTRFGKEEKSKLLRLPVNWAPGRFICVTLAAMLQAIPNHVHGPVLLIFDGAGDVHDRRDVWF